MNWKTYNESKKILGEVNVFWTHSRSLYARLIRFFTQATVSHVGFLIKEHGRVMCYEYVEGAGCIQMPASNRFGTKEKILTLEIHVYKEELLNKLYTDVGRLKYNLWGAIFALFWRAKTASRYCSEGVAEKLGMSFNHLNRGIFPSDILTALYQDERR